MEIFRDPSAPEEEVIASTERSATDDRLGTATDGDTGEAAQAPESTKDEGHPDEATAADDPGEDKLYAGRYKSVEDLEKGYQELRRTLSKEGTGKAQTVVDAVMGKQAAPAQQPEGASQPQTTPEQFRQRVQEGMERDPAGTVMQLSQYMTMQALRQFVGPLYQRVQASEMKSVMAEMAMTHSDFADLAPNIATLLESKPHLRELVLQNPAAIEDIYRMAKSELGSAAIQAAKQAGAKGAVESLQRKAAASGVPGGKAAGAQREVSEEQELMDSIFAPTRGKGVFDPL